MRNIVSNAAPWYDLSVIQKGLQANAAGCFRIVYDNGEVDADPLIKNSKCAYFVNDSGFIYTAASMMAGLFHLGRNFRAGFITKGLGFKDGDSWNVAANNLVIEPVFTSREKHVSTCTFESGCTL